MKAIVRLSDNEKDWALGTAEEPAAQPGMVKIKVAYAGVCGSDLHIYTGHEKGLPQGIHGHEFSGTVAEVGAGVTGFAPGDAVTVEHTYSTCGLCQYCQTGRYNLCPSRQSIGFDRQGAFTEYINVYPQYIHKLEGLDLKRGALTEPLACIVHGIELVEVKPAMKVLVVGPGPMGLLCGLTLKAYGLAVDIVGAPGDEDRLTAAEKAGLHVLGGQPTAGSYPLVAECSGSGGGVAAAINALEKGGTLLQVGIATQSLSLPYEQIVYKELKIQGTFCHTWKDWNQALALQKAGLLDVSPLITSVVPLEDWKNAFEGLLAKQGMKTLFGLNQEDE